VPKRPLLLDLLPRPLRGSVYHRWFSRGAARYTGLFDAAELAYARGTRLKLHPGDVSHGEIAFTGVYEVGLTRRLVRLARRGGVLCDVGANYGYYTCLWAAQRRANTVLAYEPSERNLPALRHNIERNGFSERVKCFGAAVGHSSGSMPFDPGPDEQTGWGRLVGRGGGSRVEVPVMRLDEHLASLGVETVQVLKSDVEGADAWVIAGCESLLRGGRIAHVFYEENKPCMAALGIPDGEAARLLKAWGYAVRALSAPAADIVSYYGRPVTVKGAFSA
jgi:FkbM family methyltransferase